MSQPQVKVTINRLGQVRLNAENFTGNACKAATAPVEHAFRGAEMTAEEKPELYYTQEQSQEGGLTLEEE